MKLRWRFIWQETSTAFLILYAISLAGTINGLITPALEIFTMIVLAGIGLNWLITIWKKTAFLPTFGLPMLTYGGALMISTLFSTDWRRSLMQVGYFAALAAVYWTLAEISRTDKGRLERAYLFAMLFMVGVGLFQLRNVNPGEPIPRPSSVLGNANLFGVTAMIGVIMALHWLTQFKNRWLRLLLVLWLLMLAVLVIFTASRSVWVATAGSITVFAGLHLLTYRHLLNTRKMRLRLITAGIVVAVFIVIFLMFVPNLVSIATHGTLETRQKIWQAGWDAFLEHPVLGMGPLTFGTYLMPRVSTPPESIHAHPHNIFLYVAVEAGIPGLLSLAWFIWIAAKKIRESWNQPGTITTCAFLTGLLLASLLDTPFLPAMIVLYFVVWLILNPESSNDNLTDINTDSIYAVPTGSSAGTRYIASVMFFIVPLLTLVAITIGIIQLPGELEAEQGISAARRGDWLQAALHFQRATELDPQITAYEFQAAYAYGQAGIRGDYLSLLRAIDLYQKTLKKAPNYSVHWANLAILEAYAGRDEQAQTDAIYAAKLAYKYRPIGYLPRRLSDPSFDFVTLETDAKITGEYNWYLYHVPGIETPLYPLP